MKDSKDSRTSVSGTVTDDDGKPLAHVIVRVVHVDLNVVTPIGEAITNRRGHYEVRYSPQRTAADIGKAPALRVEVLSYLGEPLAESRIYFNPEARQVVDLTVSSPPTLSIYEQLLGTLRLIEGDTPFEEWNDSEIAFILQKIEQDPPDLPFIELVNEQHLQYLLQSIDLAESTKLPVSVFFGLAMAAQIDLPLSLETVLSQPEEAVRALLEEASKQIIPETPWEEIQDSWEQAKRSLGLLETISLGGRLLDEQTGSPLEKYNVRAVLLGQDKVLGNALTGPDGIFTFNYLSDPADDDEIRLIMADYAGEIIHQTVVNVDEQNRVVDIVVPLPELADSAPDLLEMSESLGLPIPEGLPALLESQGIRTLADLRRLGGFRSLEDAPANDPTLRRLDAHANLSALVGYTPEEANRVIEAGFDRITRIAAADRPTFVEQLNNDMGRYRAANLLKQAKLTGAVLNNMIANVRANHVDNGALGQTSLALLSDTFQNGCGCSACQTVIGPAAYLVDLIDYTLDHLKDNGTSFTEATLEQLLHQPLGDLSLACEEVERQVRQVHICIDVLRRYLTANNLPTPASPQADQLSNTVRRYLETAYSDALRMAGTSLDALRTAIISNDPTIKERLALRLNIPDPDQLDQLFINFDALDNQEVERELEHLFGLLDTSRDPLSEGAKFGDAGNQLRRWNLDGVQWNKNTDADGMVYLELRQPQANVFRIDVFKDAGKTALLASGETDTPDGVITLAPVTTNTDIASSGLHGLIHIQFTAENLNLSIAAVSLLLSFRLQFLTASWAQAAVSTPIIDPDLVGLENLQTPLDENPAFFIWKARQTAIEDRVQFLTDLSTNSIDATRFADLLNETNVSLTDAELNPNELDYLNAIQDLLNQANPLPILDIDWEAIVPILLQVEKRRLYQTWIDEERDKGILLSPDYFRVPETFDERRSDFPEWRADSTTLRRWERMLISRTDTRQLLYETLTSLIDTVTDNTLEDLRDALIWATDADGSTLEAKAEWLEDRLLIDARMDSSIRTTRIALAIETLQVLLIATRTGQLSDSHPGLDLYSDDFDEEWKWIGSYNTWRAAMMVFLFPENVLDPGLKRTHTQGFSRLTNALRKNTQLTPEDACREAARFADFINDIPALIIDASCEARAPLIEEDCPDQVSKGSAYLTFLFARSEESGKAYFSTYRSGVATGFEQSFWQPIQVLGEVVNIIGAGVYEYEADRVHRYIYIFARKKEGTQERLVFVRYDLEKREIEDVEYELELPEEGLNFNAVLCQQNHSTNPPALGVQIGQRVFTRRLNRAGNGWDYDHSVLAGFIYHVDQNPLTLRAMVSLDLPIVVETPDVPVHYFLLIGTYDDAMYHHFLKPASTQTLDTSYSTSPPRRIANGQWIGSTFWPGNPNFIYTFWKQNGELRYKVTFYNAAQNAVFEAPPNIADFLGSLPGLNHMKKIAVHTAAGSRASMNRQIAFQMGGPRPGPFLGFFTRSTNTLGLFEADSSNVLAALAPSGDSGFGSTTTMRTLAINIGMGTILDGDGRVIGPGDGGDPPPPPPPDPPPQPDKLLISELSRIRLVPLLKDPVEIIQKLTDSELQIRKAKIEAAFQDNADSPRSLMVYLEEAFFFAPMLLALNLMRRGHYVAALDWFRTVYDYTQQGDQRKIYYGLVQEESLPWNYDRYAEWLLEPLNPHAIAATRQNTYTRYTLLTLAQCFLAFADSEFARDTAETIARARLLYQTALDLLESPILSQPPGPCQSLIDDIDEEVRGIFDNASPFIMDGWDAIVDRMEDVQDPRIAASMVDLVRERMLANAPLLDRLAVVDRIVNRAVYRQPPVSDIAETRQVAQDRLLQAQNILLRDPGATTALEAVSYAAEKDFDHSYASLTGRSVAELERFDLPWLAEARATVRIESPVLAVDTARAVHHFNVLNHIATDAPLAVFNDNQSFPVTFFVAPGSSFCVPDNPLIESLKSHAELNLEKIRSGRNIAGLERPLAIYSASIHVEQGFPYLDRRGDVILPESPNFAPTLYRYQTLIDRAKQLVSLAQQLESTFLSILEKRDAEYYNLLKARQDINLSLAGVRLQQLSMVAARDGVRLAELQVDRARFQEAYYENQVNQAEIAQERDALIGFVAGVGMLAVGIFAEQPNLIKEGLTTLYGSFSGTNAERRLQELEMSAELARQDTLISDQQNRIARDRLNIVAQELRIANIQASVARDTLDFLVNKFTNAELYDWMSRVLEEVYSAFLQQATSVARLAAHQLAFERQEIIPEFIQANYWEALVGLEAGLTNEDTPDRRGLTGSARLLQDIFQLDQYTFDTAQRKQELTKTISLAQMAPAEFQRFRTNGVLNFHTQMGMFDRDFPGHYLRLARRISVSVIALIPPGEGIKATLTSSGISRVVTGGRSFREITLRRPPESIALTSPINTTGQFDFELQPNIEILRPFEGGGVATDWTFELPKAANQFDYQTIADVLLTIDYTALFSHDYRSQVIEQLGHSFSADRAFSFRQELPDQWFDLNNPDQTATPMTVQFFTQRSDFFPNLENLKIQQVVLFFMISDGQTFEVDVSHLLFSETGSNNPVGGSASSIEGVISTRRGNADNWKPMIGNVPIGEWELALPDNNQVRGWFRDDLIEDILFVISYQADVPSWPS